jgi:hypothetical protein
LFFVRQPHPMRQTGRPWSLSFADGELSGGLNDGRNIGAAFSVGASLRRRPRRWLTEGRLHGLRRLHIEPATTAAGPKVVAGRAGRPPRQPIDPCTRRRRSDVYGRGRRRRRRARRKGQGKHCKTAHANRERHETSQKS